MRISKRAGAILQALLVTFLWSTSWVLIKNFLKDIPPLTFAGLRYSLAVILLTPGLVRERTAIRKLTRQDWGLLILLGVIYYALTQGGQFLTLQYLEATTFSLLLNFSTVFVAIIGVFSLKEVPAPSQWIGIGIFLAGVLVYFLPQGNLSGTALGYGLAAGTVLANALAGLLGRWANRDARLSPRIVTGISMGVGAGILLVAGVATEPWPTFSWGSILAIVVMGVVNTAFAFTLWNRSLQHLSAVESSIINNTMLIQIAVLAWVFLDERLGWVAILGLALAAAGIFLANIRRRPRESEGDNEEKPN
jgi:drug/metabolite transporter (DMT)-like permease